MVDDLNMADDLNNGYAYPFPMPSEEDVAYSDHAVPGRPAGLPSSYEQGDSLRWTPKSLADVHAFITAHQFSFDGRMQKTNPSAFVRSAGNDAIEPLADP